MSVAELRLPAQNLKERLKDRGDGWVTIGFLDGKSQQAQLAKFSPYGHDVPATVPPPAHAPAFKPTLALFPAERIAYVAFHKRPTDRVRPSVANAAPTLKVHVAGGASFVVEPPDPGAQDPVGFYATAWDAEQGYREFFFYSHGVNAKEINRPIGEMLIQEGALDARAVSRAVDAQVTQNRPQLGQILLDSGRIGREALDQAVSTHKRRNLRLGEVLVEAGLARPEDIEFALAEQKRRGGRRIGEILVGLNLISEVALCKTLAKKFQLPFVDLETQRVNPRALSELPKEFIEKHRVLPIDADGETLTVALSDPLAVAVLDALRTTAKKRTTEVVVTPTQLEKFIPLYLDMAESDAHSEEMNELLKELVDDDSRAAESDLELNAATASSDNTIVKLANQIMLDAYRRGASDIHIEPNGRDNPVTVRFRIDGECNTYKELPPQHRAPLVARIKIMANLDISEHRKPQDGKIRLRFGERKIELRVAVIPTVNNNEDVILRILSSSRPLSLNEMALSHRNLELLRGLITRPYGLILCVGPTGSGKTTTLHSALGAINTVDTKIWTAEDPVEITQSRLRQVQVNPKIGFTFAQAMRAFLRADPDVIMVGEMRDPETANIAIEASLTGHLVLSTLHTNNAPETVVRMVDMGLDPFSFSDALLGVLAQRLARSLCRQCREPYIGSAAEFDELAAAYGREAFETKLGVILGPGFRLWRSNGCTACSGTGYKGRIALHELLVTNDDIKRAIQSRASGDQIRTLAVEAGMRTLLQDGVEKTLAGLTDLKQVFAVCSR
jgi:type II secretory ATPase GspE/PulE/Tfp pilus assembly ATPase PilB-like protein